MMASWVCFDVGETMFDETGYWGRWADWLGLPRPDFLAELEAVVARGAHHRDVFERFRPGLDVGAAQAARVAGGEDPGFLPDDLFPDVRPCFEALRRAGLRIAVAGNTSVMAEQAVARCLLPVDVIASAERWGVSKPAAGFFERLAAVCAVPPACIAYVGDRIDNDVLPAEAAGMLGIWLRRGIWARAHRARPDAGTVRHTIDGLDGLLPVIDALRGTHPRREPDMR